MGISWLASLVFVAFLGLSGIKSGSASSLPPYYALAYIMRIA